MTPMPPAGTPISPGAPNNLPPTTHDRLSRQSLEVIRKYLEDSILVEGYLAEHPIVRKWSMTAFGDTS